MSPEREKVKSGIGSSVTICLVPSARGGPFVFWDDVESSCQSAAEIGFDAVEFFLPSAEAVDPARLQDTLAAHQLSLSALGTGAGMLLHQLTLSSEDDDVRRRGVEFVLPLIDLAGSFGACVIIGSMQGSVQKGQEKAAVLRRLGDSLRQLADHAAERDVVVIMEPLNRYESNLVNRMEDGVALLESLEKSNVKLLGDLFHMNIEEVRIGDALRQAGPRLGHVHFVDSNRRPAGFGHIDYNEVAAALREIDYRGYCSAEAFPYPDSVSAAHQTLETYRKYLT